MKGTVQVIVGGTVTLYSCLFSLSIRPFENTDAALGVSQWLELALRAQEFLNLILQDSPALHRVKGVGKPGMLILKLVACIYIGIEASGAGYFPHNI